MDGDLFILCDPPSHEPGFAASISTGRLRGIILGPSGSTGEWGTVSNTQNHHDPFRYTVCTDDTNKLNGMILAQIQNLCQQGEASFE